jgi:hypothetical protein
LPIPKIVESVLVKRRSELSGDLEEHQATVGQLMIGLHSQGAKIGYFVCHGS